MLSAIAAVVAGLVALTFGADKFVDGAAVTARRLGVSTLVVGIVVVGFSTSAPEMLVAAVASLDQRPAIAIGNAIGSNITNITLVLGITVLICPLTVAQKIYRSELPTMCVAVFIASVLVYFAGLTRVDGVILLIAMVACFALALRQVSSAVRGTSQEEVFAPSSDNEMSSLLAVFWLIVGLVLLLVGSRLLVYGAAFIARQYGVSELVIGLTIVAIGTSLPELAASVASARRGHAEMALGNVIGSNMFNSLGVLAMPALIAPGAVERPVLVRDLPIMLVLTLLLIWVARPHHGAGIISRVEGAVLFSSFVIYQLILYLGVGS